MRGKLIFCHYIVWLLLYGTLYSLYTHKPNEPNSQTMQSEIQVLGAELYAKLVVKGIQTQTI